MAGIDKTYVNTWKDYKDIVDWCKSIGTVTDDWGNKLTPYDWLYYPDLTEEEFYRNQKECWEEAKERYNKYKDSKVEWEKESYNDMVKDYGEDFLEHPELFYEVVIWNTDHIEDIYLIRYCPLEVIQNRLKQQYGGGWSKLALTDRNDPSEYEMIKNRTSDWDNYQRDGNKHPKFIILNREGISFKDDNIWWWIRIKNKSYPYWWYSELENYWYNDLECKITKDRWITSICDKIHGNLTNRKIYRILRRWNLPSGTEIEFVGDWKRREMKKFIVKIK